MRIEDKIEREAVAKAQRAGWLTRKLSWQGRKGAPDQLFLKAGRCVFIEFKAPGESPEGQQALELRRLRKAYPDIHVCDSVESALSVLGVGA